ncbi:MAG: nucleotidyltransferase domain-containing protein, partial [Gemmatimonadaceae bacterium]|nr:nucleotidyltransferase domain-containing protein [Gemmatimonadaceae bacterium]
MAQTGKGPGGKLSGGRSTLSLDDLVSQLKAVHGASLTAVVLYGSAATNEHVEGLSDVNVMVLVESIPFAT